MEARPSQPLTALEGGCACGALRYQVAGPVLTHVICHCESCRRATGGLQVPWFTVRQGDLEIVRGALTLRESSSGVRRGHCAGCGTTLTYASEGAAGADDRATIDITTVSLDEPAQLAPDAHIWTADDTAWMRASVHLPRYLNFRSEGRLEPATDCGFPGLVLRQVHWADAREQLLAVRVPVFVQEQGVPPDIEEDDRDCHCLHLLATVNGRQVATARLDTGLQGKIGRVAVLAPFRGSGLGRALMLALHDLAVGAGLSGVWCHAQQSAVAFYERLGYLRESEPFEEAGIPHQKLRRRVGH